MRYIKEWKSISESDNSLELSFEDFKLIMSDITDKWGYSHIKQYNSYYDCWISFSIEAPHVPELFFKELENESHGYNNPSVISKETLKSFSELIKENSNRISSILEYIKGVEKINKNIQEVVEQVDEICERFQSFSNFGSCKMGFENMWDDRKELIDIRIIFNIK